MLRPTTDILEAVASGRRQFAFMLCLLVAFTSASTSAAATRPPTIDELIGLQRPDAPVISPDGRFVAYTVRQPNWADNKYETQVWLANTGTGSLIQLTNSKGTSVEPAWSPDGRLLGVLSDRDGTWQIYVISPTGGEARKITTSATGVLAFRWSPNGKRIAFTAPDPESEQIKRRKEKYSDFEVVRHDYRTNHLWIADMITQTAQRITQGNAYTVDSFSWSPDGKRLAFDARTARTFSESTSNIYVCNLDSGTVTKLLDEQGPDRNPHWSPDGKSIAFETVLGRPNFFTQNTHLGIVSAEGGPVADITPDFDERATLIGWGPGGVYFSAEQKTAADLFVIASTKRTIQQITPLDGSVYDSFSFTADFKRVAFIEADSSHYPEVYVSPLKTFAPRKLTDFAGQLKDLTFATREVVSWKNSEGTPIEGVLMKPLDFDPTKKYPLLVMIHGGPGDTTSQAVLGLDPYIRYYPTDIWATKGALVLEPNYRGSAGYGAGFHRLSVRTIGAGDYDDIISGVDSLIAKGWVDKDRVGAMGWSFGGFISAWIATNSERFKAVSIGAGATDWILFDATTNMQEITRQYLGASPSSDLEIYRTSSPITYAKQGKTPTIIQHGEFDPVVPIGNAYELYQALADQGVPTRFYLYKGFGHSITKPKANRAVMEHNLNWFNHYLWGEPDQETAY